MYGREELKVYYADLEGQLYKSDPFPGHGTATFIRKSEADKVMDALEARIKELEAENSALKDENLKHRKDNITMSLKYNEVLNDLNDENARLKMWTHRQKYKRCLAMAEWCDAEADVADADGDYEDMRWYQKWHERWLEIADKLKENR